MKTEPEKPKESPERTAFRAQLLAEVGARLPHIERCSRLSTEDYCRAILLVASNDALLRVALERGQWTRQVPDVTRPEPPPLEKITTA